MSGKTSCFCNETGSGALLVIVLEILISGPGVLSPPLRDPNPYPDEPQSWTGEQLFMNKIGCHYLEFVNRRKCKKRFFSVKLQLYLRLKDEV